MTLHISNHYLTSYLSFYHLSLAVIGVSYVMDKIVVIGSAGSGKSTFAQALSEKLQIEVIHLDRHFWLPGWREYPRATRIAIQQELVREKDQWIIEGTYLGSSDDRLIAADTIIFLDMPRLLCLWRVIMRHKKYLGRSRPDLPDGCTDKISLFTFLKVLVFPHRGRELLLSKIDRFCEQEALSKVNHALRISTIGKIREQEQKVPSEENTALLEKTIITFKSSREIAAFLVGLSVRPCSQGVHPGDRQTRADASLSQSTNILAPAVN